jgi:hypothetical protein
MRTVLSLLILFIFGSVINPALADAAQQRVAIRLAGRYCMFHAFDLEQALKRVSGVIGVDFESMRGNVIIIMRAGQVNPDHLLSAVRQVKGDGYYCKGEFNGEPGKVEH